MLITKVSNMYLNKEQLILQDIASVYLPRYHGRKKELVRHWQDYNAERLVELAMAQVGGYDYVDAAYYDFSDYSDAKTASIGLDAVATVGHILGRGREGQPKVGDLRVVLFNPFKHRLEYYFMPKAGWESIREYGKANAHKLRASYNVDHEYILKWRKWRVADFETLAKMPATITQPNDFIPIGQFRTLFEVAA